MCGRYNTEPLMPKDLHLDYWLVDETKLSLEFGEPQLHSVRPALQSLSLEQWRE